MKNIHSITPPSRISAAQEGLEEVLHTRAVYAFHRLIRFWFSFFKRTVSSPLGYRWEILIKPVDSSWLWRWNNLITAVKSCTWSSWSEKLGLSPYCSFELAGKRGRYLEEGMWKLHLLIFDVLCCVVNKRQFLPWRWRKENSTFICLCCSRKWLVSPVLHLWQVWIGGSNGVFLENWGTLVLSSLLKGVLENFLRPNVCWAWSHTSL